MQILILIFLIHQFHPAFLYNFSTRLKLKIFSIAKNIGLLAQVYEFLAKFEKKKTGILRRSHLN